ncbi:ATP-binding protein, partial [Streptomyces niveus]
LPVRPPGRTMAAADRDRAPADGTGQQDRTRHGSAPRAVPPGRDAGTRFGAFHRARRPVEGTPEKDRPEHGDTP